LTLASLGHCRRADWCAAGTEPVRGTAKSGDPAREAEGEVCGLTTHCDVSGHPEHITKAEGEGFDPRRRKTPRNGFRVRRTTEREPVFIGVFGRCDRRGVGNGIGSAQLDTAWAGSLRDTGIVERVSSEIKGSGAQPGRWRQGKVSTGWASVTADDSPHADSPHTPSSGFQA
jgi:hypothetical protein